MERTTIEIRMTEDDFEQLGQNGNRWADIPTSRRDETRFVPMRKGETLINWSFDYAHWFNAWSDVILARAFLEARGHEYQVLSDEWSEPGSPYNYVITTNYASPVWQRMESGK